MFLFPFLRSRFWNPDDQNPKTLRGKTHDPVSVDIVHSSEQCVYGGIAHFNRSTSRGIGKNPRTWCAGNSFTLGSMVKRCYGVDYRPFLVFNFQGRSGQKLESIYTAEIGSGARFAQIA
jgi:hypothetical protein